MNERVVFLYVIYIYYCLGHDDEIHSLVTSVRVCLFAIDTDIIMTTINIYFLHIKYVNAYSRINSTAPSYFKPSSIRARATRTGARPRPATQ